MTDSKPKQRFSCLTKHKHFHKTFKVNLLSQEIDGVMRSTMFLEKKDTIYVTERLYNILVNTITSIDLEKMQVNFGMQALESETRLYFNANENSPKRRKIRWYIFKGEIEDSMITSVVFDSYNHRVNGFNLAYKFNDTCSESSMAQSTTSSEGYDRVHDYAVDFQVKSGNAKSIDTIDDFLNMIASKVRQAKQCCPRHVRSVVDRHGVIHSVTYEMLYKMDVSDVVFIRDDNTAC